MSELAKLFMLNVPLATYAVLGMHFTLMPRKNKLLTFLIIEIPFVFLVMLKYTVQDINYIVSMFIAWVYLISCGIVLYSDSIRTKVFNIAVDIGIQYVVSLIVGSLSYALGLDTDNISAKFIVFALITFGIAYYIFVFLRKKRLSDISNNRYTVIGMTAAVAIQLVITNLSEILQSMRSDFNDKTVFGISATSDQFFYLVSFVISILFLIMDIALFLIMNRAAKSIELKKDLEYSEAMQDLYMGYYAQVEANSLQTRKIRHDVANIIETVGVMLNEPDTKAKEKANDLYEKFKAEFENIHTVTYCNDTLLNAILSAKASRCKSFNIATDFDVALFDAGKMDNTDICRLFTNLLDNAINATQMALSEKKIILKIARDSNSTIITTKNPFDEKSVKKSEKGHGYGLKIIRDIVKKYKGRIDIDNKNGLYITQIILPDKK